MVKNLMFKVRNEEGNITEEVQLTIKDGNGIDQAIQVHDEMTTETYFQVSLIENKNPAVVMKEQGYLLINKLIINPKVNDNVINQLPWLDTLKIIKALREEFMPEDAFLELGVQLDTLSQE